MSDFKIDFSMYQPRALSWWVVKGKYLRLNVGFTNSYYNFQYPLDFVASCNVEIVRPKKLCASGYIKFYNIYDCR